MKRSVIRVLDELVNLIVLVIVLILGGYGVYTLWDDRQIYQSADMENYETWRPEEDDDLSFRELQAINPEVRILPENSLCQEACSWIVRMQQILLI